MAKISETVSLCPNLVSIRDGIGAGGKQDSAVVINTLPIPMSSLLVGSNEFSISTWFRKIVSLKVLLFCLLEFIEKIINYTFWFKN